MYSTCLFCNAALGSNEVVEAFPIGGRLAFDAAKGRLWVVCRKCERWNLTPLEERWEAIEDCERRFRDARLRVSTDNVGLAKLREGLELVRIGAPQRPELAAWRYGDQFGRRRRQAMIRGGIAVGAVGAILVGASAAGASIGAFWWMFDGVYRRAVHGSDDDVVGRVADGRTQLVVRRKDLAKSTIVRTAGSGVELQLRHAGGRSVLQGDAALVAARQLLPQANRAGGSRRAVQDAVELLERAGDAERAVRDLATLDGTRADRNRLLGLGFVPRLALEMALHEEQERRALAGELAELERAWREAEEVAGIADDMFVEDGVLRKLDALKRRDGGG